MKTSALWILGAAGLVALALSSEGEAAAGNAGMSPAPPKPPAPPDSTPSAPPSTSNAAQDRPPLQPTGTTIYAQPQIITALWQTAKTGETGQVDQIKNVIGSLTPELQVYLAAAATYVYQAYQLDQKFRNQFEHEFDDANKQYQNYQNGIDIGLGIAGAAVNAIPGAGQIISAVIALGIGIKRAVMAGLAPEERKISENEQIFRDWEGSDCIRGLRIEGNTAPTAANLKTRIANDLIAGRLPIVENAYKFEFTPTVEQFTAAARKAGLYSEQYLRQAYGFSNVWNLEPNDDFPTTAAEIVNYVVGYQVGQLGQPYPNDYEWGKVGFADAMSNKPSRISKDLEGWASQVTGV